MPTRIATVSLMRNEADIVEAFARYHLQFVTGMLFVDHRSTDNSREIVAALKAEGLPVELRSANGLSFDQTQMVNAHTAEAATLFKADWILPLDLDECVHGCGISTPISELQHHAGDRPVRMPWRTYVPTRVDDQSEKNPFKRITHRLKQESEQFYKIAAPSRLLEGNRYYIGMGNHGLVARHKRDRVEAATAESTWIAHFPVRTPEQYMSKILLGWLSILVKDDRNRKDGYHWKRHFDRIVQQGNLRYEDLESICIGYLDAPDGEVPSKLVSDPLPSGLLDFTLTNPVPDTGSAFANAMRFAEEIAEAYGKLRTAERVNSKRHRLKLGRFFIGWE